MSSIIFASILQFFKKITDNVVSNHSLVAYEEINTCLPVKAGFWNDKEEM